MAGGVYGTGLKQAAFDALPQPVQTAFKTQNKTIQDLRLKLGEKNLTSWKSESQPGLLDLGQVLKNRFEEIEKSLQRISRAGLVFTRGHPDNPGDVGVAAAIDEAVYQMDRLLNRASEGATAVENLADNMSQFKVLAEVMNENAGKLAANAAALNELGLSYGNFNKNLDLAIYSFNMTGEQVGKLNQGIFNFSKQIGMLPNKVATNFQGMAKSMAYNMGDIQKEFTKIQAMAAKTGVSVDTLMGKFGDPLDTIGGASDFASRINTMLGGNVFSATEVFTLTESERMDKTRKALQTSQIYRDYQEGDQVMKKFALKAIAEGLGMSIDQARRFLTGGDAGDASMKDKMAGKIDTRFKDSQNKFTDGINDLTKELEKNAARLRLMRMTPLDRIISEERAKLVARDTTDAKSRSVQGLGTLAALFKDDPELQTELFGKESPASVQQTITKDPRIIEAMRRVSTDPALRSEAFTDNANDGTTSLKEIAQALRAAATPAAVKSAQDKLSEYLSATQTKKTTGTLNAVEMGILSRFNDSPNVQRRLARFFLGKNRDPESIQEAGEMKGIQDIFKNSEGTVILPEGIGAAASGKTGVTFKEAKIGPQASGPASALQPVAMGPGQPATFIINLPGVTDPLKFRATIAQLTGIA